MTRSAVAFLLGVFGSGAAQGQVLPGDTNPARSVSARPQPRDTLDALTYEGWKRYSLFCDRCHGQDAGGTTFGSNLVAALAPDGTVPSEEAFLALLAAGRPERGMPAGRILGLDPEHYPKVYAYLRGRSTGRLRGGRPALREP